MPNTAGARKRLRQSKVRRDRNRSVKTAVRTQIKKVREAVAAGDVGKAETEFVLAAKQLDRAGSHRVMHPNTTSRYKSRLSQLIRKAKQAS
ncbi:MAG: 30S ribosomal protein S20 [Pirellulaceae bacterium]|nr:30S ribosomal protein S20 [Planctomycetales bacterium]